MCSIVAPFLSLRTERSVPSVYTSRRALPAVRLSRTVLGVALGPAVGLLVWCLPLELAPMVHKVLAITAFMVMYWIAEPVDYGITALFGCYLFWALGGVKFSVAFSGFASSTPWFILGVLLLGQVASDSGLAQRIGFMVMRRVGVSPARLLFGLILLVWLLGFLIPSPNALFAILAPLVIGIIAMLGVKPQSNIATGLFVSMTYMCNHVGKLLLGSGGTALASGLIAEQTGIHVWWSQWLMAFLPDSVLTVVACYLTVRWLYPPDTPFLSGGQQPLQGALSAPGPWTRDEKKALSWMLLAVGLWATDFIHHLDPALVAIGVGLCLTLPHIGLLDTQALKRVNFVLICFFAGALSMGTVLMETKTLNVLMDGFVSWLAPLLTHAFVGAAVLYGSAFLYHFILASDPGMIATSLPVLLELAQSQGYNPAAVGLAWTFATTGKLFVYQAGVVGAGYAYGYFQGKDWCKVSGVMSLVQGLILMVLVPVYWPLLGLPWRHQTARPAAAATLRDGVDVQGPASLHSPGTSGAHLAVTWTQAVGPSGQFDWRSIGQPAVFVEAGGAAQKVDPQLQSTPGKPAFPAGMRAPQIEMAVQPGKTKPPPSHLCPRHALLAVLPSPVLRCLSSPSVRSVVPCQPLPRGAPGGAATLHETRPLRIGSTNAFSPMPPGRPPLAAAPRARDGGGLSALLVAHSSGANKA